MLIHCIYQLLPISHLSHTHPQLSASDFQTSLHLLHDDSSSALLLGLSVLELCLLVAVRKISELTQDEAFNFEMVYSGK